MDALLDHRCPIRGMGIHAVWGHPWSARQVPPVFCASPKALPFPDYADSFACVPEGLTFANRLSALKKTGHHRLLFNVFDKHWTSCQDGLEKLNRLLCRSSA